MPCGAGSSTRSLLFYCTLLISPRNFLLQCPGRIHWRIAKSQNLHIIYILFAIICYYLLFCCYYLLLFTYYSDLNLRQDDLAKNMHTQNKNGHGTTLGRPFGAFRVPTKIV